MPSKEFKDKKILFVIGAPTSLKSVQSEMIASKYSLHHICTKDILQDEMKACSENGCRIRCYLEKGLLVPADLMTLLLKERMLKLLNCSNGYVIDGFPKNLLQLKLFKKEISSSYSAIIHIKILESTLRERLKKQLEIIEESKRLKVCVVPFKDRKVISLNNPSECCASNIQAKVKNLMEYYYKETGPLLKRMKNKKTFFTIDAENSNEVVFQHVVCSMDKILRKK